MVEYLVGNLGVDAHINGEMPMRWAAGSGHLSVVKYLVEEHRADPGVRGGDALIEAGRFGRIAVVNYLAGRLFDRDLWRGKRPGAADIEAGRLCESIRRFRRADAKRIDEACDRVVRQAHATTINLRNEKRRATPMRIGKAAPPVDL
jgi:hypothetical protein